MTADPPVDDDLESMSVDELRAEVRRLRRLREELVVATPDQKPLPDWHRHYWGGSRHFTHSHPALAADHDHHGYTVTFQIGGGAVLLRDGHRLEGEVTP
nr:hypothetical protein [Actinomycetota bacterium]